MKHHHLTILAVALLGVPLLAQSVRPRRLTREELLARRERKKNQQTEPPGKIFDGKVTQHLTATTIMAQSLPRESLPYTIGAGRLPVLSSSYMYSNEPIIIELPPEHFLFQKPDGTRFKLRLSEAGIQKHYSHVYAKYILAEPFLLLPNETPEQIIARLEKENAALQQENAALRQRIKELETTIADLQNPATSSSQP